MATSRHAPALVTETASVAPGGPIIQTSSVLLGGELNGPLDHAALAGALQHEDGLPLVQHQDG